MSDGGAPTTVLIVAGEASGDMHAASLVRELKTRTSSFRLIGIGGSRLVAEGLEAFVSASRMNFSGFAEVVRHYRFLRSVFKRTVELARTSNPDIAILVDYPGFNLRLARALRKMGIPVIYYIAPQVWAWKEGRVARLRRDVDALIVVFPFEVEYFARHGITAHFFGHPVIDSAAPEMRSARRSTGVERTIVYLPGSRGHEVKRHMPLILGVMRELGDGFRHVVALASTMTRDSLEQYNDGNQFEIASDARDALASCDAALVKAGTSTIEAAVIGVPFAAFYRTSRVSYEIARRSIRVAWIAMVNILAGRAVVREFIQEQAEPASMAQEIRRLCDDDGYRRQVIDDLDEVRRSLGAPGAAARAAEFLADRYFR